MPDRVLELLDEEITKVEFHLDRLKAFRDHWDKDPVLASIVTRVIVSPQANGPITPKTTRVYGHKKVELDKIVEYMQARPGQLVGVPEMQKNLGIDSQHIYPLLKSHPDIFVCHREEGKRKQFWSLSDAVPPKPQ